MYTKKNTKKLKELSLLRRRGREEEKPEVSNASPEIVWWLQFGEAHLKAP